MLALCGQPYNEEDIQVFVGLVPFDLDMPLDGFGVEEWSVVDVIVEESEIVAPDLAQVGDDGVCRANCEDMCDCPVFEFNPGDLQDVNELSIALSGRVRGV